MKQDDIKSRGLEEVIPTRNRKIGMTNPEMNARTSNIPTGMKAKYVLDIILEETIKRGENKKLMKQINKKTQKCKINCIKCAKKFNNKNLIIVSRFIF